MRSGCGQGLAQEAPTVVAAGVIQIRISIRARSRRGEGAVHVLVDGEEKPRASSEQGEQARR